MRKWLDSLTVYCIQKGIVREADALWFKYALEKRISTACIALPFFILAVIFSNFFTASCFFLSFYILRSKTNGFHANSLLGCICISLLVEVFLFLVIYPYLNTLANCVLNTICGALIMILSPFNHPSMSYSEKERIACRSHARRNVCIFLLVAAISILLRLQHIASGITLGIAMTAFMLCLAYILEWRKTQCKKPQKN